MEERQGGEGVKLKEGGGRQGGKGVKKNHMEAIRKNNIVWFDITSVMIFENAWLFAYTFDLCYGTNWKWWKVLQAITLMAAIQSTALIFT